MIAFAAVLSSCGRESNQSRPTVSTVSDPPPAAPVVAVPAAALKAPIETEETIPPDLDVSPVDTLVVPGQAVEFVVRTTPDVTRLALSDGRDEPLAFVREGGSDRWSVTYRVPLRTRVERWGVSITARTDANRWRRVWVFLHARNSAEAVKPDATVSSIADSTTGTTP
jgi:hypothetical protein